MLSQDFERFLAAAIAMTREAQSLRRDHNFAPDTAIRDVALALRGVGDVAALERVIATLPPAAADFWRA